MRTQGASKTRYKTKGPADKTHPGRQARVSAFSLEDERIVGAIFQRLRDSTTDQDLRRQAFKQVAKSAKLQDMLLDALSRQPELQPTVLRELAKNPQLKRKFVVVAHEEMRSAIEQDG